MRIRRFLFLCLAASWAYFAFSASRRKPLLVAKDGTGDYHSVQQAIDALPAEGGTIHVRPGVYREVVKITKSHVRLVGDPRAPSRATIVFDNSHGKVGSTLESATVSVVGDDFFAEGITFVNDFSVGRPLTPEGSQAVALLVRGDRAVLRHVRLLGAQDTLFTGSKSCDSEHGPCVPARQYFSDCYIEGNVDFIFGDGETFFKNCEIHAIPHSTVFLTAQSKHYPQEESGYVFDRCTVTADSGAEDIYLGRPWRPYSTVVFMNANLRAKTDPAGWREWHPEETHSLDTSFYAEFRSKGVGAGIKGRDPHSRQLTKSEARSFSAREFLSGPDHWNPEALH
jgi:pectin methylesterase-like acyl-CoA thioesterase